MSQGKLIVAALRLPVTMARKGEGWVANPSGGGLVTGLKAVAGSRPFVWIGWPGSFVPESDRHGVTEEIVRHGGAPIFLSRPDAEGFYSDFSNRVIWPLFHGLVDRVHFSLSAWRAYVRVNEMYADEISRQARAEDIVWVHDYQLCLVPEMLRDRGLTCPVGFFLHIPFPSSEMYRTLPVREDLLKGLLGADLLGFHAYEYVGHFRKACLRVLGVESQPESIRIGSREVSLTVQPIGIDPEHTRSMAATSEAKEERTKLQAAHRGKKIILGVERLDYTKGITHKFLAYEEFLRAYPKWRQKVVLIQVAAPSRLAVDEYRQLKRQVDELVGRINGRFGTSTHTPIVYVSQNIPQARLTGMYQAADVALITPVRDGLNLVALEYVAARGPQGGMLILSEFAGAANLLSGARLISPYNLPQVAEVLHDCLEESPTPETTAHMLEFVHHNTSTYWAQHFLERLQAAAADPKPTALRLRVKEAPVVDVLRSARRPLVLLDYDGTLRSYERKPADAVPTARIRKILQQLAERAIVYIVSGRDASTLESWLGDLPVGLVCEHGFAMRPVGQGWEQREVGSVSALSDVEQIFGEFCRRTPGSMVEAKRASVAWHYRSSDPEYGTFQANELLTVLEDTLKNRPYHVLRGNRVIEVRHQDVSKGVATTELVQRHADADALFCAGDDRTDEDMMDAVARSWRTRAVTCWVGVRSVHADFWVESTEALLTELSHLVQLWRDNSTGLRPSVVAPPSQHVTVYSES